MAARIDLHPAARIEALEAEGWYWERSRDAALGFTDVLAVVLSQISSFPLAGAPWPVEGVAADIRRVPLRRYPFVVFYVATEREVTVVAIAHAKRRPGYWTDRLQGVGG